MTTLSNTFRNTVLATLAAAVIVLPVTEASAVSLKVKIACKDDYFAHCSQHEPGSAAVRQCMRSVGKKLSQGCRDALVEAGLAQRSKSVAQK